MSCTHYVSLWRWTCPGEGSAPLTAGISCSWTNKYIDTKTNGSHLKKIDLWDFAAGVYQSLQTEETVSHGDIFDPALGTVALRGLQRDVIYLG